MKPTIKPITLIALASSALAAAASAQTPGTEAAVTFAMNVYVSAPGTYAKDPETGKTIMPKEPATENSWSKSDTNGNVLQENYEYMTKLVTTKLSNKEILTAFVEEGLIESITGWSFVVVGTGENGPYFYLVKKGASPVYLGDYFDVGSDINIWSGSETYTETTKYNTAGDETSHTVTGSTTDKSLIGIAIATSSWDLSIQGVAAFSSAMKKVGTEYVDVSKGGKITLNGSVTMADVGEASVVDGTWTVGADKTLTDISTLYPEAAE